VIAWSGVACVEQAVKSLLTHSITHCLCRCSNDGIPFILHDHTFRRTTNIADVFPQLRDVEACWLNMSDIKRLDAGSWFLRVSMHYWLHDVISHSTDD